MIGMVVCELLVCAGNVYLIFVCVASNTVAILS